MTFTVLKQIPAQLRGRGSMTSLALKHDCAGAGAFLWSKINARPDIKCPYCKTTETLTEDAPVLNGSQK